MLVAEHNLVSMFEDFSCNTDRKLSEGSVAMYFVSCKEKKRKIFNWSKKVQQGQQKQTGRQTESESDWQAGRERRKKLRAKAYLCSWQLLDSKKHNPIIAMQNTGHTDQILCASRNNQACKYVCWWTATTQQQQEWQKHQGYYIASTFLHEKKKQD